MKPMRRLSARTEKLFAGQAERKRKIEERVRLYAALDAWNEFYAENGAFADEHSTL